MSVLGPALGRAVASSSSRSTVSLVSLGPRRLPVPTRSGSSSSSALVALAGRRPFSSSSPSPARYGLSDDAVEMPLAPHLARVQKQVQPEIVVSAEEQQLNKLRDFLATNDRPPRDNEIPPRLLVQPFFPNDPRPRPPIPFAAMKKLAELEPYKATHHLVLIKISLGHPSDLHSYSIVRVQSKEDVAEDERIHREKRKETERRAAVAKMPSSLGKNSGLRNQAAPKELEATWVMSDHDMEHRMNQAKGYINNAFRVTVKFMPKRTGKKLKIAQDQKADQLEKAWAMVSDVAEKYEQDRWAGETVTMFLEPSKEIRKNVGALEKQKHEEEVRKREADFERKAKLAEARKANTRTKWKPGQPIPTAGELEGK